MKVRDIMSQPPQICHAHTDVATASRRMKETAAGMLIVLDDHGRIAGVLTDRDLALSLADSHGDIRRTGLERAITRRVHTCNEDDDLHQALARMASKRVRRLPVLNSRGDVQAVISIDDIILWAVQQGGVTPAELASALRHICAPHAVPVDPELPRF
jgi:CBS domain-containing protein